MSSFARRGDFWSALVLSALGAWIVVQARSWAYITEDGPGPGFFPLWYGGVMIVLSLLLAAGTVLKSRRGADVPAGVRWADLGRALACWAAFVGCIVLMKVAGFVVSFALLTWFIVAVMARRPQRVAVALALGGSLLFYALFELALDVSLPKGMLF